MVETTLQGALDRKLSTKTSKTADGDVDEEDADDDVSSEPDKVSAHFKRVVWNFKQLAS
jgi:hypothetical protein